jgi:hypothetical protein
VVYTSYVVIKTQKKSAKVKTGPKPELYKIEGMGWEDAVKKSLQKKKPTGGWPK